MRDIRTTLMGNVTADPSERTQSDGSLTAILRLAVTGRYFDNEKGSFEDRKTEFVTVFARRALARNVLASVGRGQPLIVHGRLGSSEWVGEDGSPRHSLTLQAEAIGHDLTFGAARFARAGRDEDIPDHDPLTGEMLGDRAVIPPDRSGHDEDRAGEGVAGSAQGDDAMATA